MDSPKKRPYTLIQFLLRGRQQRSIEIVPWKWVSWNEDRKKCVIKYPNPPYSAEMLKEIHTLTQNLCEAPHDWPTFNARLRGTANTYSEALEKLDILERYEHAFTSDDSASEKEKKLQKSLRQKKLKKDETKLQKILEGASIEPSVDSSLNSNLKKKSKVTTINPSHSGNCKKRARVVTKDGSKPKIIPIVSSLERRAKVVAEDATEAEPTKILNVLNLEPVAQSPLTSTPKRKCYSTNKKLTNTYELYEDTSTKSRVPMSPIPSTSNAKDNCGEIVRSAPKPMKQTVATRELSSSNQLAKAFSNQSQCIASTPRSNNVIAEDRSASNVEECVSSVTGNAYENLVSRVDVLKRPEPTDEIATVLTLCKSILLMVNDVQEDVRVIKRNQKIAMGVTAPTYNVARHIGFCEEFGVTLPFKTIEEFSKFDERLRCDELLHSSFLQYLSLQIVVDHGLNKNITTILKIMFSRGVAMQFTAVKRIKNKQILKDTVFALCIYDTICKRRNEHNINTTNKEFYSALGVQLTNSKDWDGHRSQRQLTSTYSNTDSRGKDKSSEEHSQVCDSSNTDNEDMEVDKYTSGDDSDNREDRYDEGDGDDENVEDDENKETDETAGRERNLYDIIKKPF